MHKKSLIIISLFSFLCVGIALVSQYQFNMLPCPWCILQRIIFIVIGLTSIGLYFLDKKIISIVTIVLLSIIGQLTALYQFVFASQSTSCKLSLAEKIVSNSKLDVLMPYLFEIKTSCADSVVKIFGLNYEIYSLTAFSIISSIIIVMNLEKLNKKIS